jgi:hypothetical protein
MGVGSPTLEPGLTARFKQIRIGWPLKKPAGNEPARDNPPKVDP